jgi:hypothetical protein
MVTPYGASNASKQLAAAIAVTTPQPTAQLVRCRRGPQERTHVRGNRAADGLGPRCSAGSDSGIAKCIKWSDGRSSTRSLEYAGMKET